MKRIPDFRTRWAELAYEIATHLYRLVMIGYFPLLIALTGISELKPYSGFIDFGFGFSLLVVLICTVPIFLCLLGAGFLVRFGILRLVGAREVDREARPLRRVKAAITTAVITVTVACLLFVPFSTIYYDDGGTEKTTAVAYTVMKWNRTQTWDGEPVDEPGQRTRVYWFPHNFKSYEELWEMRH
jgi:hypothetical protein